MSQTFIFYVHPEKGLFAYCNTNNCNHYQVDNSLNAQIDDKSGIGSVAGLLVNCGLKTGHPIIERLGPNANVADCSRYKQKPAPKILFKARN